MWNIHTAECLPVLTPHQTATILTIRDQARTTCSSESRHISRQRTSLLTVLPISLLHSVQRSTHRTMEACLQSQSITSMSAMTPQSGWRSQITHLRAKAQKAAGTSLLLTSRFLPAQRIFPSASRWMWQVHTVWTTSSLSSQMAVRQLISQRAWRWISLQEEIPEVVTQVIFRKEQAKEPSRVHMTLQRLQRWQAHLLTGKLKPEFM